MRQRFKNNQKGISKKKPGDDGLTRILSLKDEAIPVPPTDLEWMKLEQRIEIAEVKAGKTQTAA